MEFSKVGVLMRNIALRPKLLDPPDGGSMRLFKLCRFGLVHDRDFCVAAPAVEEMHRREV